MVVVVVVVVVSSGHASGDGYGLRSGCTEHCRDSGPDNSSPDGGTDGHLHARAETPSRDRGRGAPRGGSGKGRDKWPRSQSKGNARASGGGWERDHRTPQQRRHQGRSWNWERDDRQQDRRSDDRRDRKLLELCLAASRLMMRHEDQLSINRAQDNFVMFAQTKGLLSAIPELYKATEAWRLTKSEHPETLTLPLRAWLLKHWVDLLHQRMEAVMESEQTLQQAKELLILDEACNVPYLEWNRTERKMQIKKDRDPMTLTQVLELLRQMPVLVLQPLAILRFHTTRELVQNMQSDVVPLMLQIGSRTAECHQLWNAFYRLSHSGACRVVATSLRGDKMGRSALAQAIQKLIDEMCAASDSSIPAIFAIAMLLPLHCAGSMPQVPEPALNPLSFCSLTCCE